MNINFDSICKLASVSTSRRGGINSEGKSAYGEAHGADHEEANEMAFDPQDLEEEDLPQSMLDEDAGVAYPD